MSLDLGVIWEVQTTGADKNGGGFDPVSGAPGTDYTYGAGQATFEWAAAGGDYTNDLASTSASGWLVVTSVSRSFVAADVGNILNMSAGTNFTVGCYQVLSVAGGAATLDRACGSSGDASGGSGVLGGALATPGQLSKFLNDHGVDGMLAYIKSGTYSLTSGSASVAGGTVSLPASKAIRVEGYETTRGDLGAKAVLDANAQTSVTLWMGAGGSSDRQHFINLKADGQDNSGVTGFGSGGYGDEMYRCEAVDCPTGFGSNVAANSCLADSCATFGFDQSIATRCKAKACGTGFYRGTFAYSLAHDCTGDGFGLYAGSAATGCGAWNNGSDGFYTQYESAHIDGCWAAKNTGGYGFNVHDGVILVNCADWDNTSGKRPTGQLFADIGHQTLTGDPFENSGTDDFRPNDTAGAGALLRGNGGGIASQTNNTDIGPVQHADPAGGGGGLLVHPGTSGGARG